MTMKMKYISPVFLMLLSVLIGSVHVAGQSVSVYDIYCENGKKKKGSGDEEDDHGDCSAEYDLGTIGIDEFPVSCHGGEDGGATASVGGGIPPFTFQWSNGTTGPTISNVSAGTYYVEITDLLGRTRKDSAVITQPMSPLNVSLTYFNGTFGNPGSTVTAFASGGTSPYTYLWDVGGTGPVLNLIEGPYTLTVTDLKGCTVVRNGEAYNQYTGNTEAISANAGTSVTICPGQGIVLGGNPTANGGIGDVSIAWTFTGNGNTLSSTDSNPYLSPAQILSLIGFGTSFTATVDVTDDIDSASSTITITVDQPPLFSISAPSIACFGSLLPINLNATPVGGVWSGPGIDGDQFRPDNAGIGTHTIYYTFTSAAGCEYEASHEVEVIQLADATIADQTLSNCVTTFDMNTFIEGDHGGAWTVGPFITAAGILNPSALTPGDYLFSYKVGTAPCDDTEFMTLTIVETPTITLTPTTTDNCSTPIDLTTLLSAGSPTNGAWSGGMHISGSTFDASGLAAGSYPIVYTHSEFGCTQIVTSEITVTESIPSVDFTSSSFAWTGIFTDASIGNITSWLWSFGDGGTAIGQNPLYTFPSEGTFSVCLTVSNDCVSKTKCDNITVEAFPGLVQVQPIILLAGAFEPGQGLMRDNLRFDPNFPIFEPYSQSGTQFYLGGGGEQVNPALLNQNGPQAVVDWVVTELRHEFDPSVVVASKACILTRQGQVVDANTGQFLQFNGLPAGNYYVALRHRNHLGVMTANAVPLNDQFVPPIDFANPGEPTFGQDAQLFDPNSNLTLMWPGDSDGDKQVIYAGAGTDVNLISTDVFLNPGNILFSPSFPSQGYNNSDLNLDGITIYAGFGTDVNFISQSVLLNPGNPGFSPSVPVVEQIP